MIGRIRGKLVHKQAPDILVEVGGVGYELQVPMTTLFQLPALGSEVSLVTHFVVREDAQLLYGFIDERDRMLFRQLIKVSGVGPKLGLTILSGMDARSFVRCVQRDEFDVRSVHFPHISVIVLHDVAFLVRPLHAAFDARVVPFVVKPSRVLPPSYSMVKAAKIR